VPHHIYCFGVDKVTPVAPAPAAGRLAFLTDAYFRPGGGIQAADGLCAAEASAAGIAGRFKAWLATSTSSAGSRFASSPDTVWVRLDGIPLNAPGAALLAGARPLTALNVTSRMRYVGNYGVMLGATAPAEVGTAGSTCDDWQSTSPSSRAILGRAGIASTLFRSVLFAHDEEPCHLVQGHLYCLED